MLKPVGARFFARDSRVVAPELLNKVLVRGPRRGRIVEVEAYAEREDPASHAFRGPTRRNATMFGPAGRLYVYFTYGMHWCANAVCGAEGEGTAVLLRAVAPLAGLDLMRQARGERIRDRDLASGPAKLCQAFAIDKRDDGTDLTRRSAALAWIADDGTPPPVAPGISARIGISRGVEHEWRWFVPGDPNLSRRT